MIVFTTVKIAKSYIMISVRRGAEKDIAAIAAFQVAMALETESLELMLPVVIEGVRNIISNPQTGYYLIAEHKGETAGCMMVLYEWSDWRNGYVVWLHSVYIDPRKRRLGVFRYMFEEMKREVEGNNSIFGIRLYVDNRNTGAINVYRNLGMDDGHYRLFEWLKE